MAFRGLIFEDTLHRGQLLASLLYKMEQVEEASTVKDWEELAARLRVGGIDFVCWVAGVIGEREVSYWRALPQRPGLIVVGDSPETALAAFELGALDFLTLPVRMERLQQALQRTAEWSEFIGWKKSPPYFFVKSDYRIVRIALDDILFVESLGEYVRITTGQQKVVTLLPLGKLAEWLPQQRFVRIHRSYIINLDKVNFIQNNVVSLGSYQLPISKSQRKAVLEAIQAYGLL